MITKILKGDKEIYLIGTAHVSKHSVEEVKNFINTENPDVVCVELCKERYNALKNKEKYREMNLEEIIKQGKFQVFILNLLLASFQRKIGKELNVSPGEEMIEAINECEKRNIKFLLVDRDIRITLKRAIKKMSIIEKYKFFTFLIYSLFFTEKVSEEDIEKLKNQDALSEIIKEISLFFPSIKSVLIDERDYYISRKIFEAQGKKILAVVGAGHIEGIKKNLENFNINETLEEKEKINKKMQEIEEIPKDRNLFSIAIYIILALIVILFVYGLLVKGFDVFLNMTFTWIILHSTFSAIGAIIALANIRTIIASFIFSPFAAWHPGISIGMIAGLVEAKYNPPKISDFENLSNIKFSKEGIKMLWKNRITKIILVFFLTNLGGSIATFVAGFSFMNILF